MPLGAAKAHKGSQLMDPSPLPALIVNMRLTLFSAKRALHLVDDTKAEVVQHREGTKASQHGDEELPNVVLGHGCRA